MIFVAGHTLFMKRGFVAGCCPLLRLCCWFCCQFLAVKSLIINNVANVAGFQTS